MPFPLYEFHVSRSARQLYQFDEALFGLDGNVILADFAAARRFAERMSLVRGVPVPAGEINAMGLIDEVLHVLVRQYELEHPGILGRVLGALSADLGAAAVDGLLLRFVEEFPPMPVQRGERTAVGYLAGSTAGTPHRQAALEELLLLSLANQNPALEGYRELFDETPLRQAGRYDDLLRGLQAFFGDGPGLGAAGGGQGEPLLQALRAPALASPASLIGQLEYLLKRWGPMLGERFVLRLLRGLDYVREEVIRRAGPPVSAAAGVPVYGRSEHEYERFSADSEWMPRLVLIARNTYVWLDQLSKRYQRDISRLDQVPDEELDLLAARGFSGLWLIGLWERSRASQRIKQRMGQQDAGASAYSLMSYDIAGDLGGWDALASLRARAWSRGVRLAADMVPNHMGIDSRWVIEHPDWFVQVDQPPFPGYQFQSEDLCDDERVGVFIEDHYYSKSDAAVVFKRIDRWSGDVRYIYHGNDGTSFPWNDTAQLDFLKSEVREAVIQTILHVARNFPVIRFDAAMTLARKHVQRLWYPEPGGGGAIPSRAEHGLPADEFLARMPQEFWRELVDRVAAEVPDTLLLAEAFWLMEGYFVRTLGMHRVYNSAFMHMLRDEDNAKYRAVMKNTMEFDPQILQRFVNFMNNPDEKTAAEQFGTTDKYFGVATLLATLPGLPMFGHGQVEGFREKYGMEFRRAKWDEPVDEGLVRGHELRIFPLLHRRRLFAGAEHFLLYDFFTADGAVNEDVFAFSNGSGDERALVIYHNRYAHTAGWIRTSAAYMDKATGQLRQRSLADGLGLREEFACFRDHVSGLEYIRSCGELAGHGLYVELDGYQCHVFLEFRFVSGEPWRGLHAALNGRGVPSLQAEVDSMAAAAAPQEKPKRKPRKTGGTAKKTAKPAAKKTAGKEKKPPAGSTPTKKPAAGRKSG